MVYGLLFAFQYSIDFTTVPQNLLELGVFTAIFRFTGNEMNINLFVILINIRRVF